MSLIHTFFDRNAALFLVVGSLVEGQEEKVVLHSDLHVSLACDFCVLRNFSLHKRTRKLCM